MSANFLNFSSSAPSALNQLQANQQSGMQEALLQLATGSRLNSGANDAAGLAIANGLSANQAEANQSVQNISAGIGQLQVADGALSQVNDLLDRSITLATQAANGGLTGSQQAAVNNEFQSIQQEITNIGANTTFNGQPVFSSNSTAVFTASGGPGSTISVTTGDLSAANIPAANNSSLAPVDLTAASLSSPSAAASALNTVQSAIINVASNQGAIGATMNQLSASSGVLSNISQNTAAAESGISDANIAQTMANLNSSTILAKVGMAAQAQANLSASSVLQLL